MRTKVVAISQDSVDHVGAQRHLEKFAPIAYLFGYKERLPHGLNFSAVCEEIAFRLKEVQFDPDRDFIAMIGKQAYTTALTYVLAWNYDDITLLLWEHQEGQYVKRRTEQRSIPAATPAPARDAS